MLLLHRILIQCCMISHNLSNFQINMSTAYMNANFNKMLKTSNFSTLLSAVFILKTLPINRLSTAGAALVNTISSN